MTAMETKNKLDKLWKKFMYSNIHGDKKAYNYVIWNHEGKEHLAEQFAIFVEGHNANS